MDDHTTDLADLLLDLASALRVVATQAEQAAIAMTPRRALAGTPDGRNPLEIDRSALTVRWNGQSCFLGYTTAFRLMERLAQRPNHYVSHAQLLADVWGGPRSSSAIRSAVADLKARLTYEGMAELANAVDGSNPGHYGLIIRRLS